MWLSQSRVLDEKLMKKLQNHTKISSQIVFSNVDPGDSGAQWFYLVYSSRITVAEAVASAFKLGTVDKIRDIAMLLLGIIRQAFRKTKVLTSPPTLRTWTSVLLTYLLSS